MLFVVSLMTVKNVVLAVSGGVDSAVSALLLKQRGFHVLGVFMKNWDITDETGACSSTQDAEDAHWVCSHVGIPFHSVNFVKEYWHNVFCSLVTDYQEGITPNPDILCNRQIKFNLFYKFARNKLRADAISTGHYAQTSFGSFLENYRELESVRLLKAADDLKDQTFFLSQVPQQALRKTMFPLGNLTKKQVKDIARAEGMGNIVRKKESMGICFIGSRNFQNFISEYIPSETGKFIDIESGHHVADHQGKHHWTIGQGCKIGGQLDRYFVAKKFSNSQDILIANGTDHPSLFSKQFYTSEVHWIHSFPNALLTTQSMDCEFRFQHTKALTKCRIYITRNHHLFVSLETPLRAITPGQYAVFYKDTECLGSARITDVGPSLYTTRCLPQRFFDTRRRDCLVK